MGFDFSALDAELEALGKEPADLLQLAARYAGDLAGLAAVDSVLSGLGEASAPLEVAPLKLTRTKASSIPPPPPRAPVEPVRSAVKPAPSMLDEDPLELAVEELTTEVEPLAPFAPAESEPVASSPRSGELALPSVVKRPSKNPISGELQLDQGEPTSGSFALPEPIEEPASPLFVTNRPPRPDSQSGAPDRFRAPDAAARAASDYPEMLVDSLEEDDPDTQAVFAALDELPDSATPSGGAVLKGLSDLPGEPGGARPDGRNVDAEFDAIFSDATSPSGIPTRGFGFGDDDSPSAEELLTGLEADPPRAAHAQAPSEQYSDSEDHTEILDKGTLNSITAAARSEDNPFPEELGSSEFEIVLDADGEPTGESDNTSGAPPKRSPPPPLPPSGSTNLDKRPSFLGRIFGRKDGPPN
jgi:hypothetical protein